ncbi:caspase family protein [Actinokineospora iranica]|uniref:Peptide/nickel transport system substrate-binding protein n=1 Tax=Actinokineospora iranica TaxID=1271860 RepID=A0A1G6NHL5_9PSEU|nr:caspase family protein [Actinokineospora iranica]SDC66894.1 peptide/nickel transport system substrate-binding protein [Actinokineospora iranica]
MRRFDPDRSRAVLIGIGDYARFPALPAVANNLAGMTEALTSPDLGGMPREHCAVLDSTADVPAIGRALAAAADAAEDMLLVYFAGHGTRGMKRGELFLTLADTDPAIPAFTALDFDSVRDLVVKSATVTVVILDCCFSGRATAPFMSGEESLLSELEIDGTCVLTASPANKVALSGPKYSEFTGELLAILRDGIPGGDPLLSLEAIYTSLARRMAARGLPTPQWLRTATADLLALAPNRAHAPLPPERWNPRPLPKTARIIALGSVAGARPGPVTPHFTHMQPEGTLAAIKEAETPAARALLEQRAEEDVRKAGAARFADFVTQVARHCLGENVPKPARSAALIAQHGGWAALTERIESAREIADFRSVSADITSFVDKHYRGFPQKPKLRNRPPVLSVNRLSYWWGGFDTYLTRIAAFCEPPHPDSEDLATRLPLLAEPLAAADALRARVTELFRLRRQDPEFRDKVTFEMAALHPIVDEIDVTLRRMVTAGQL